MRVAADIMAAARRLRSQVRKALNGMGYDFHRLNKDTNPLFDMRFASIRTVTRGEIQSRFLVADSRDAIQSHHDCGRFYEEDMLDVIGEHFPNGGVFVDVGANVGNHCVYVANHLGPSLIVAFEPMKLQHAILVVNVLLKELQNIVEVHKKAASSGTSLNTMITPNLQNTGRSMIEHASYGEWVELVAGDDILAGRRADFLKIDVEGHEMEALAGLRQTIATWKPKMLIEVADRNAKSFERWRNENAYEVLHQFRHYAENSEYLIAPTRHGLVERQAMQDAAPASPA